VNISVELSHLTLLTFTDYFPHIIKKKNWMLKLTAIGKNILLLNYAVFKTIVHVLVLYQTSNKLG
jgi:accessory gene regulator protein AgrB